MSLICKNCEMLTEPFSNWHCEFCGEDVRKTKEDKEEIITPV